MGGAYQNRSREEEGGHIIVPPWNISSSYFVGLWLFITFTCNVFFTFCFHFHFHVISLSAGGRKAATSSCRPETSSYFVGLWLFITFTFCSSISHFVITFTFSAYQQGGERRPHHRAALKHLVFLLYKVVAFYHFHFQFWFVIFAFNFCFSLSLFVYHFHFSSLYQLISREEEEGGHIIVPPWNISPSYFVGSTIYFGPKNDFLIMIQFREKIKTAMIDFETPPLWLQSFLTPQQVYHLIGTKCKYGPIKSSNHVSGGQKDKW